MAVVRFTNKHLKTLYETGKSRKHDLPPQVQRKFFMRIQQLEAADVVADLLADSGLNFEAYGDHYSVRLNKQYRLEFDVAWRDEDETVIESVGLIEVSAHYGD